MYNAPRSASIFANQDTIFWVLDRKTFKQVVEEVTTKQYEENRALLEDITFFKKMNENQKDSIAFAMISQRFQDGVDLVSKGDQANSYYIIKSVSDFFILNS